jgi:hypothetical protein
VTPLLRSAPGGGAPGGYDDASAGERPVTGVDPRMRRALTDLHAYVLALNAERERLGDSGQPTTQLRSREDAELALLRVERAEEVDAVRSMLIALRACADPEGKLL